MGTVYTIIHTRDGDFPSGFPTDGWRMGGGHHTMAGGDRPDTGTDTIMGTTMATHADTVLAIMPGNGPPIRAGLRITVPADRWPPTMFIRTVPRV